METLDLWVNIIANTLTIFASGLAIYIYFKNKDKISSALKILLNYSHQLTLTDLKFKVERLNDLTVNDVTQKDEIINILHEIEGQIQGNSMLVDKLASQLIKIQEIISNPKRLDEPRKRSIVSLLKESIRNLDVSRFDELTQNQQL